MSNGISKDTFKGMDVNSKLDVLFDYAIDSHKNIKELKKRPIIDKGITFLGGALGGALAFLGITFGKN